MRWFLGLVGALILVAALFVAVVLWRLSPTPYELTADQSLHRVLTGRWDWSTSERPCAEGTHSIAFSEDRKIMTITQSEMDSATGVPVVTTYDIVREGPSSITGAIRGETRRTEAGQPVVWELILIRPDRYVWRRTDWSSWGSTAAIVRCNEQGVPVAG